MDNYQEALAEEIIHLIKDINGMKLSSLIKEVHRSIATRILPSAIVYTVNELIS